MRVIVDTREKLPVNINCNEFITDVVYGKLNSGDYSIETLEDIVAIERKGSITEFAHNIIEDRFWRCIDRLENIKHPLIVMAFPFDYLYSYPDCCDLSDKIKKKMKINSGFLISKTNEILYRKIPIIFAGDSYHATKLINDFLCKTIKRYK